MTIMIRGRLYGRYSGYPQFEFTVIGHMAEDCRSFVGVFPAADACSAARKAIALHPDLLVAAVLLGEHQDRLGSAHVVGADDLNEEEL